MEPLATIEDFIARHGDVPSDRRETVNALLGDASALIRAEGEGSEALWVTAGDDVPDAIMAICVRVAYRAFSNPDAVSRTALGAASYTFRADVPDALYLTKHERRIVRRAGAGSSFRTITLETPYTGETVSDLDFPFGIGS